jgi:hypothetical protein
VRKLLFLLRTSSLDGVRWARQHVYVWLVLGPIILGLTYLSASRFAENIVTVEISSPFALAVASAGWLAFVTLGLSRVAAQIYHVRHPESLFDALPVESGVFLHTALLRETIRLLWAALLMIAARSLLFPNTSWLPKGALPPLLLLVALTSTSRVFGAVNWIHWAHSHGWSAALVGIAVLLGAALSGGALAMAFFGARTPIAEPLSMILGACVVAGTLAMSVAQHASWRWGDIEYARRLPSGTIRLEAIPYWLNRLWPDTRGPQLARDLRLTVRGFSSAVYVVAALAVLLPLALFAAIKTFLPVAPRSPASLLDSTWLPQVIAIKATCVLEVSATVGVLPVLVAYELPHLWLERSVGSSGLDVWGAKLAYSRLITLPGCLLVCAAGLATLTTPPYYSAPLVLECLWLWWMLSSLAGALAFEMPTRPALSLVLITTVTLGAGAITALAWPAGLLTYAQAMYSLKDRGRQRARYYLLTEAE